VLKEDKERVVAELVERLRTADTLIVADYRGLDMTAIDDLRTELLKHGARFSVVKNTLTRRAADAAGVEALGEFLEGPTAIAFVQDGDMVAVAKALNDTARQTRILSLKGGILDGRAVTADQVRDLATLPPTDVLRGQVVGAIVGPLNAIVGLFTAPLRDLVGVLDARTAQLREQGDADDTEARAADEAGAAAEEPQAAAAEEPQAAVADEPQAAEAPEAGADDGEAEDEAQATPDVAADAEETTESSEETPEEA
jgi:large subunit ribosomal protein L10